MKRTLFFKELPKCVLATLSVAVGVALYIDCQIGADSVSVFLDGMNKTFGFPISVVDQLLVIIFFVAAYLISREKIGVSTIVHTLIIGICIEIAAYFISPLEIYNQPFWMQCLGVFIAQLFYAFGFALMQNFTFGMSTADALIYGMMKKTNLSYVVIHFIFDAFYFVVGFLLGGVVGVGSIFYVLTAGFLTFQMKKGIDYYTNRKI